MVLSYSSHTKTDTMLSLKRDTQGFPTKQTINNKDLYCCPNVASVFQACIRAVGALYRGRIGLVDAMNSGGIPDSC